jgi:hypothetical protein
MQWWGWPVSTPEKNDKKKKKNRYSRKKEIIIGRNVRIKPQDTMMGVQI